MNRIVKARTVLMRTVRLGMLLLMAVPGSWRILPDGIGVGDDRPLVRVGVPAQADLERFAVLGIPIYAQLANSTGETYLLAEMAPAQVSALAEQGFPALVLDVGERHGDYYLLTAFRPGAIERARTYADILQLEGTQAVARVDPDQVEKLPALGLELRKLALHPLVLPRTPQPSWTADITPDPVIQVLIDQVDSATVNSYDGGLSGEWPVTIGGSPYSIMSRYSRTTTPIEKATQYAYEHFQSLGLGAQYHLYNLSGSGQRRNVIAEQPGVDQPERVFMIVAHLDSTSENASVYAPGADDNASGSTAVLIAADILSQYNFDCTLRYALFTGEEQGLVGSAAYAQQAFNNGDNIEGVLNLDMIGYNSDENPIIELHARPGNAGDQAIADLFFDVISAYNLNLIAERPTSVTGASDHASFWDYGYPAILGIEDFQDFTPYYHTTGDRLNTLDMTYFTDFVKAAVGTFAHMGCLRPLSGYLAGRVSEGETFDPLDGARVRATDSGGQDYVTYTDALGDYRLELIAGTFNVTASKAGYISKTFPGIQVTEDYTTTLNIALELCHPVQGADFVFSPVTPEAGQTVVFTGTVGVPSSPPLSYLWDFGDGSTGTGELINHSFVISDTYPVQMSVSNCGGSTLIEHPVSVTGAPEISVSPSSIELQGYTGQSYTQTLTIANLGSDELNWSLAESPAVAWLEAAQAAGQVLPQAQEQLDLFLTAPDTPGVYTTALQVSSNDADESLFTIPVTLTLETCLEVQGLDFTFNPGAPRVGETVFFTGTISSASPPIQFLWDFGDNSAPVQGEGLETVAHIFPLLVIQQTYQVSLSAWNICSAPSQVEKAVLLSPWAAYLPIMHTAFP